MDTIRCIRRIGSPAHRFTVGVLLAVVGLLTAEISGHGPAYANAAPAGAMTAAGAGAVIAAGTVALTFDDGPSAGYTARVLDVLAAHEVKATFCLVGTQVRRYPELVRRIVAEGHALCNHSMRHDNLATWTAEEIRADLVGTLDVIRAAAPDAEVPYFRAPYGSWGQSATIAAELGMVRLSWTVDPRDWSRPGTEVIVEQVLTQLRPGGIVLMHDAGGDRSQTVQALGLLLPELRERGWTFTFPPTPL
jgi:peptidoglycan/xylan/chitin deacetylase (PgdA/CDA1 family)